MSLPFIVKYTLLRIAVLYLWIFGYLNIDHKRGLEKVHAKQ